MTEYVRSYANWRPSTGSAPFANSGAQPARCSRSYHELGIRESRTACVQPGLAGGQHGNGSDLSRVESVPQDSWAWTRVSHTDYLVRGDDQAEPEVVLCFRERLVEHLELVNGCGHCGVRADDARVRQQAQFDVGEPSALSHPRAAAVDRDAACHGQIDPVHMVHLHGLAQLQPAVLVRGLLNWRRKAFRVEHDERVIPGEPRNCHIDDLPVLEGACSDR